MFLRGTCIMGFFGKLHKWKWHLMPKIKDERRDLSEKVLRICQNCQ